LDQYRKYFVDTATRYNFDLVGGAVVEDEQLCRDGNTGVLHRLDTQYCNSSLYEKGKYELLRNDQSTGLK
jgi:hypothetical protein